MFLNIKRSSTPRLRMCVRGTGFTTEDAAFAIFVN
jgi:hypothetical protein